jgi:hypothetical protein
MTARSSLRVNADYSEDTVGFALESFLTLASFPRQKFTIEPFTRSSERYLGADGRIFDHITGFKPFYMQFKRPSAYPSHSTSHIITDRQAATPTHTVHPQTLFFELRQKTAKQREFQHNILYKLSRRLRRFANSDAAYVCPLFLSREAYRYHLHISALRYWPRIFRRYPWDYLSIPISTASGSYSFSNIPSFKEHVSIPPHAVVTNANHRYSFTEDGTEVFFHSPEAGIEVPNSFSEWLSQISEGIYEGEGLLNSNNMNPVLSRIVADLDDNGNIANVKNKIEGDGYSAWLEFGDYLSREYGIEQYAFINWMDEESV